MQITIIRALHIQCLLAGIVALTIGCDPTTVVTPASTTPSARVSTTARLGQREIIEVELAGFSAGHQAGQSSKFTYGLRNLSGARWAGEYCILFTNRQKVVLNVKHEVLNLAPGEHIGGDLQLAFPKDIPEGTYDLDILVPSEGHQGIPLTVGTVITPDFSSVYVPSICPN